ncbi:TerC family protein [Paenibacillus athensensis]|uniref:SpoVT-AbrB domain-containing protein n=1 Tax=Paenibacillus athensensis TaxID=1967502 RepID=A0A4Y8Q9F7_9BACL|nr:TerC family protein [Paenibacillus athensensis]MCD1259037.1 TerC family protein [Paenibacillus athensensis]
MEGLSPEFLAALLGVIVIDLVLAGDNALVIGIAASKLPPAERRRVIWWGTAGAVLIRVIATLGVSLLLKLPGLLLAGGLALLWIAYRLLAERKSGPAVHSVAGLGAAIRTIIVADAVMGFDNVIAVAGAAHGSFALVAAGLAISVPLVVWGSGLFARLLERRPALIYAGAGVLAFTAGKMLAAEPLLGSWLGAHPSAKWLLIALLTFAVLAAGKWSRSAGYLVRVGARGELTLPQELSEEARICPDDRYTVIRDEGGRLTLVKLDAEGGPGGSSMPHAG